MDSEVGQARTVSRPDRGRHPAQVDLHRHQPDRRLAASHLHSGLAHPGTDLQHHLAGTREALGQPPDPGSRLGRSKSGRAAQYRQQFGTHPTPPQPVAAQSSDDVEHWDSVSVRKPVTTDHRPTGAHVG
jgi:hypothetical protein